MSPPPRHRSRAVLPLQQIDASIFAEVLLDGHRVEKCKRYLGKIGVKYSGIISVQSLGKVCSQILREQESGMMLLDELVLMIKVAGIGLNAPDLDAYTMVGRLIEIEPKLEPFEALDLATAATGAAVTYVTLNHILIGHRNLQRELGIKIMSPYQL